MIYLTAQPDDYYFLWQLELQLFNFNRLGIKPEEIHVLIGYDEKMGLASYFVTFFKENKQAQFYAYPDQRKKKKYLSSLRPHIIAQHFNAYPRLQNEHIFYHDSDIIFNRLPDFEKLNKDEIWYASATGSYTNINYIKRTAGEEVFYRMCKLLSVKPATIIANDQHMGGAQYLLKKVTLNFWKRLERDCEKMFPFLKKQEQKSERDKDSQQKIQAWCTDMWCLWWQAMSIAKVATHPSLDFTWADSSAKQNEVKHILHYTGKVTIEREDLFRKGNYIYCSPFEDDFSKISVAKASIDVVKEINLYNTYRLAKRKKIKDVTLIIPLRTEEPECLEKVKLVLKYLYKNISCSIIVVCKNELLVKESIGLTAQDIVYLSSPENDFNNFVKYTIASISTTKVGLLPQNLILPIKVLKCAISRLKQSETVVMSKVLSTDRLMQSIFAKSFDISFLAKNHGKLNVSKAHLASLFTLTNHPALHQLLDTYLNQKTFAGYSGIHFLNDAVYAIG